MMKKIMLLMFIMIFLVGTVGFVSSAEWDNVKSYNKETRTVTIINALNLPLIGNDIAKVKLLSDLKVVLPPTYTNVSMFEITGYIDYESFISDIELYNMKNNMKKFDRQIDIKYWGDKEVQEYDVVCGKTKEDCIETWIGSHTIKDWIDFSKDNIKKDEVLIIALFTHVKHGDKVEWIPTFAGVEVNEWAEWEGDLDAGLVSCWTLDEASGIIVDFGSGQQNNGTLSSGTYSVPSPVASLGTGIFVPNGENITVLDDASISFTSDFTIGIVLNFSNVETGIVEKGETFTDSGYTSQTTGGKIFWSVEQSDGAATNVVADTPVNTGDAVLVLLTYDAGTNVEVYINGTSDGIGTGNIEASALNFVQNLFFGENTGGSSQDKYYYELFALNYSVLDADAAFIWNSGDIISCAAGNVAPTVILNSPDDDATVFEATNTFNTTITDDVTVQNVSLIVNGTYIETNSSPINNTPTLFEHTFADLGLFNWTVEACDDENACTNATTRNITYSTFFENSQTFNASSFETASESFTVNITSNGTTPTGSYLWYDDTPFLATITNTANDFYNFSRTIDIPLTNETKNWHFNFSVGGGQENTSTQSQIINGTTYILCEDSVTPVYLNLTFKNETVAEEFVTSTIDSDWNFWLGVGSIFKTFSLTNATENANYSFCLSSGNNRTLTANVSLTYTNSISEQREFSNEFTLTNETTNQTLFLLPTADGVFSTFQTVTLAEQIITSVTANVTLSGDLISSGVTDDAGLIQYFLDPDTTYVFKFFKTGFDLVTITLKPTQSTFTVTMGGAIPPIANDTTKGISYNILPTASFLSNNTITEFNLSFTSEFFSLDSFGFALKNSTGDVFNVTSDTIAIGGDLGVVLDTGNNTDIIMEIFWTINTNQTNVTRVWAVLDTSDEGFSINNFFSRLNTYLTSGLFGLNSFGLGIIIFIVIILTTGIISSKFQITDATGISLVVFALVLFFDVGLGLIPNPINAVPNFPSIFVGLILIGTLIKRGITR